MFNTTNACFDVWKRKREMNKLEYETLIDLSFDDHSAYNIQRFNMGTLLYDYDCDRRTWHIYKDNYKTITKVIYSLDKLIDYTVNIGNISKNNLTNLIPNKRLYPARCDLSFCLFLKQLSLELCFTNFGEEEQNCFNSYCNDLKFYGFRIDDFDVKNKVLKEKVINETS